MKNIHRIGIAGSITAAIFATMFGTAVAAPLIDEDSGSITVHKYETPVEFGDDNHGLALSESQTADLEPLEGATFQVQQIQGIDLKTNTGWQDYEKVYDAFTPLTYQEKSTWTGVSAPATGLGTPVSQTTGANGEAFFANLPVGAYYVLETSTPTIDGKAVSKVTPWLMTVPMTHPDDLTDWVYDVHAYPKNVITEITKEVTDNDSFASNDKVEFDLHSTIPGGEVSAVYIITDQIDARLRFDSLTVKAGSTNFVEDSDYTFTNTNGLLTITLTEKGRTAAYAALVADNSAMVDVHIITTALEGIEGTVENQANLEFANVPGNFVDVDSNKVESKWGGIRILKNDKTDTALAGAEFEIWASHTDDFKTAEKLSLSGVDKWITPADGRLDITGLRYSEFADGKEINVANNNLDAINYYWLKEVKAPEGYQLLAQPIPFKVDQDTATFPIITVHNVPEDRLPLTGSNAVVLLTIAGVVLIAGAGAVMVASRRKSDQ